MGGGCELWEVCALLLCWAHSTLTHNLNLPQWEKLPYLCALSPLSICPLCLLKEQEGCWENLLPGLESCFGWHP